MAKYVSPVEKAYNEGRSSITAEEGVSLRKRKKKKGTLIQRLARAAKMAALGSKYKSDYKPSEKTRNVLPSKKEIEKERLLGGRKTAAGRAFRRQWMKNK